jgi:hypothetical protein
MPKNGGKFTMYLLNGVNADFTDMPFNNLLLIIGFLIVVLLFISLVGINLKWGDREINIGGLWKRMSKKDDDEEIKERLKKVMDGIDEDMKADLYDLNDEISYETRNIYQGVCYFPAEKMADIVKSVLDKRVDRNKLTEKLSDTKRSSYIQDIKKNVREKYTFFYRMSKETVCKDIYPTPDEILGKLDALVDKWDLDSRAIIIKRKIEKIGIYKDSQEGFKVQRYRQKFCLDKIRDNIKYIRGMGGEYK